MASLPDDVRATIGRFATAFPVPQKSSGESQDAFEDRCRDWSKRVAEQVKHDHPLDQVKHDHPLDTDSAWGIKASSPTNPPSKDSLALKSVSMGLESWDLLLGVGTGSPSLSPDPEYHYIPQQHFIAVVARDHVGGGVPDPGPTPDPDPDPGGPDPVLARLDLILKRLDEQDFKLTVIETRITMLETGQGQLSAQVAGVNANVKGERLLTLRTAAFGGSGSGKILPL